MWIMLWKARWLVSKFRDKQTHTRTHLGTHVTIGPDLGTGQHAAQSQSWVICTARRRGQLLVKTRRTHTCFPPATPKHSHTVYIHPYHLAAHLQVRTCFLTMQHACLGSARAISSTIQRLFSYSFCIRHGVWQRAADFNVCAGKDKALSLCVSSMNVEGSTQAISSSLQESAANG